jgi:hypothetical protein
VITRGEVYAIRNGQATHCATMQQTLMTMLVFRFAGRQLRSLPPKGAQASLGAEKGLNARNQL